VGSEYKPEAEDAKAEPEEAADAGVAGRVRRAARRIRSGEESS
jgi:hypothetical protein